MILDFLAERVCQAREASNGHADRQVRSLHLARADVLRISKRNTYSLPFLFISDASPSLPPGRGSSVSELEGLVVLTEIIRVARELNLREVAGQVLSREAR